MDWVARSIASRYIATSCVVKVFVAATPISGPARVYMTWSTSRVIAEPMTLAMATVLCPRFFASRAAAIVSSVSPLCVTSTTSGFSRDADEYRYSDDIWTVVGYLGELLDDVLPREARVVRSSRRRRS